MADPEDLGFLLEIQANNLATSLTSEEKYKYGFLSYIVPGRTLEAIVRIDLLMIAERRHAHTITGFAAGMSFAIAKHIPFLQPVITEVLEFCSYPCFIQLVVESRNTRKSIGTTLLRTLLFEAKRQNFRTAVIDVPYGNEVAQMFLKRMDFYEFSAPLLTDRKIFCKDISS